MDVIEYGERKANKEHRCNFCGGVISKGETTICDMSRDIESDENMANAKLIAAAPQMIEALEGLIAMCNRQRDFNDDGDGRTLERAEAAIRAAKGDRI